jgi:hypothetical protein
MEMYEKHKYRKYSVYYLIKQEKHDFHQALHRKGI